MKKITVVLALLLALSGLCAAQSLEGCKLSTNQYDSDSTSNPYGRCGSPYSADSINNPYGKFGSKYSPYSVSNPYTTQAPRIVAPGGTYLGRYSANPYDQDSTSNPYGEYGSDYSSDSINNPYSSYGSKYSNESPNNQYATDAPTLVDSDDDPD